MGNQGQKSLPFQKSINQPQELSESSSYGDKFGCYLDFGDSDNNSSVKSIKIMDLDGSTIQIHFQNSEAYVCDLLKNYSQVTNCEPIQGKWLCFRDYLSNKKISNGNKISMYSLDIYAQLILFRVGYTDSQEEQTQQTQQNDTQYILRYYLNIQQFTPQFSIMIDLPSLKKMELKVNSKHKIGATKLMILFRNYIPFSKQILLFKKEELEDLKCLEDYGIGPDSVLQLKKKVDDKIMEEDNADEIGISVPQPISSQSAQSVPFSLNPFSMKKKIRSDSQSQQHSFTVPSITVNIKKITGKNIVISVNLSDSVQLLKKKIEQKQGIPASQQRLVFSGKQLEQGKTLQYYGIYNESVIHLVLRLRGGCFRGQSLVKVRGGEGKNQKKIQEIELNEEILSYNESNQQLEIDKVSFIQRVKVKFYIRIQFEDQSYVQCTPNHKFLTSNHTWQCYQLTPNSEMTLTKNCQIIDYKLNKKKITQIKSIQLSNPQTFYHLSVEKNHTFIVNGFITHNMEIIFRTVTGETFTISVEPSDKVSTCQRKIEEYKNIPTKLQILTFSGKQLDPSKSLSDYNITKDSTIHLTVIFQGFWVAYPQKKDALKIYYEKNRELSISDVKKQLSEKWDVPIIEQLLIYKGKQIEDGTKCADYEYFKGENKITLFRVAVDELKSYEVKSYADVVIRIKFSESEEVAFSYAEFAFEEVKAIISYFIPNSRSTYCLMFGNFILKPQQKLNKLEQSPQFSHSQLNCILLKAYDKLVFMGILKNNLKFDTKSFKLSGNAAQIFHKSSIRIKRDNKKYKQQFRQIKSISQIYTPIQYYTCNLFFKDLNQLLRKIQIYEAKAFQNKRDYNFCSCLVTALGKMKNYIGVVHRGIKQFKFASHHKVNDTFYWAAFTSTSKCEKICANFKDDKGSVFHINSLMGKDVSEFSVYPQEEEVVFMPYTYFMVDKIVRHYTFDEVWMSELPSPVSFKKNVIVWVDDKPTNNLQIVEKIDSNKNEILQLTSTKMAEMWMKEFAWILNWKGIQMRIISDMVRLEEDKMNYYAGIDLLEMLYNKCGYTTPMLIYCSDTKQAEVNIKQRKIRKDRIYRVTNQLTYVLEYSSFEKIEAIN